MKYIIVVLILVSSLHAEAKKEYYENGGIKSTIQYKSGGLIDVEKHFYENGDLKRKIVYGDLQPTLVYGTYERMNWRDYSEYFNKELKECKEYLKSPDENDFDKNYKCSNLESDKMEQRNFQKQKSNDGYLQIKKLSRNEKIKGKEHYQEATRISKSKEYYTHQAQKLIEENYKKACDLNHAESCTLLGILLDNKDLGAFEYRDPNHMASLHRKACTLGSGEGCYWLAWSYWHMIDDEDKDMPTVIKYYQKSCDLGHISGCSNLANTYLDGKDVPINHFEVNKYFTKACDLGSGSGHSCDMSKILTKKGYNY